MSVQVFVASPVGDQPVPVLDISGSLPIGDVVKECKNLQEAAAVYDMQAQAICDALTASLPGGTLDRVLAELLKRKASLFAFPSWLVDGANG